VTSPEIKHVVRSNTVHFMRFRRGTAFYAVTTPSGTYEFPVDVADIGDATLLAEDRAMLFMRYIRRAMADGTFVRVGVANNESLPA
jgi:hypothetical protein